jgi:hypothetical protein
MAADALPAAAGPMTSPFAANEARLEAHGASYEATLAALVRRAGKARPNSRGGPDWTLGTGQVVRTSRHRRGTILSISVHANPTAAYRYQLDGIDTVATPTQVAANLLQGTIDGELDSSIAAGQRAYRKVLG